MGLQLFGGAGFAIDGGGCIRESRDIVRSLVAVPLYVLLLPFALVWAHDRFMSISVKLCDHIGKLLAVVKINPIREPYVTE